LPLRRESTLRHHWLRYYDADGGAGIHERRIAAPGEPGELTSHMATHAAARRARP